MWLAMDKWLCILLCTMLCIMYKCVKQHDYGDCHTINVLYLHSYSTNLSSVALDEVGEIIDLSEYLNYLIGEDDWCGQDIEDKSAIDLTADAELLKELDIY